MAIDPLLIPAFAAGVVTFLAPCTLPLLPAFLAFISGVPMTDLGDKEKLRKVKSKIVLNAVFAILGFSFVFMLFGSVLGLLGIPLLAYRYLLLRIGGGLIILFGLFMVSEGRFRFLSFLYKERRVNPGRFLKPGNFLSSFLFGATFGLGWTPCIGPVLGTIMTLAVATGQVLRSTALLAVFSLGLGLPFLLVAMTIAYVSNYLAKIERYLNAIYFVAGLFLIFIGILLVFNLLPLWTGFFYQIF